MKLQRRTAYGLDTPQDDRLDWRRLAACREDPDLWAGSPKHNSHAVHICEWHCPVLDLCRADAERCPPDGLVQAGLVWTEHGRNEGRPVTYQPKVVGCGRYCVNYRVMEVA